MHEEPTQSRQSARLIGQFNNLKIRATLLSDAKARSLLALLFACIKKRHVFR